MLMEPGCKFCLGALVGADDCGQHVGVGQILQLIGGHAVLLVGYALQHMGHGELLGAGTGLMSNGDGNGLPEELGRQRLEIFHLLRHGFHIVEQELLKGVFGMEMTEHSAEGLLTGDAKKQMLGHDELMAMALGKEAGIFKGIAKEGRLMLYGEHDEDALKR